MLDSGDIEQINNILELKNRYLSNQNSSKNFSLKPIITNINSNNPNKLNISISNSNNDNNSNYILPQKFFVDEIKDALYNYKFKSKINQPFTKKLKNESELFYINMLMNGKSNVSSKKLLGDIRNCEHQRKINKSMGGNGKKISNNKEIIIENNKSDNLKNKNNNNILKRIIERYRNRKKSILDTLKIDIKKLEFDIDSSNVYCKNRQNYLETQNELNTNHIYDDLFY